MATEFDTRNSLAFYPGATCASEHRQSSASLSTAAAARIKAASTATASSALVNSQIGPGQPSRATVRGYEQVADITALVKDAGVTAKTVPIDFTIPVSLDRLAQPGGNKFKLQIPVAQALGVPAGSKFIVEKMELKGSGTNAIDIGAALPFSDNLQFTSHADGSVSPGYHVKVPAALLSADDARIVHNATIDLATFKLASKYGHFSSKDEVLEKSLIKNNELGGYMIPKNSPIGSLMVRDNATKQYFKQAFKNPESQEIYLHQTDDKNARLIADKIDKRVISNSELQSHLISGPIEVTLIPLNKQQSWTALDTVPVDQVNSELSRVFQLRLCGSANVHIVGTPGTQQQ